LFGADGKLIATYRPIPRQSPIAFYMTQEVPTSAASWWVNCRARPASCKPWSKTGWARWASIILYGEERNTPQLTNDQVKFATYTRDSATGLNYADRRYYASTFGRFMTPDPYQASAGIVHPQSWNIWWH
jgi:RHS repeat-associated protein